MKKLGKSYGFDHLLCITLKVLLDNGAHPKGLVNLGVFGT